MNLNNIESAGNFEEIFEKVSKDFNIFVKDLQEDFSEFSTQNEKEIQNLKDQLASLKKVQKETAEEKMILKKRAEKVENNSSCLNYSLSDLEEELSFNKKSIKYAKSKIRLYELCKKIDWDSESFTGKIEGISFNFDSLPYYDQVNSMWDML